MRRGEQGQNLIEMALLMPVLIMIMVGVVDMGRAYHHYIMITNASREGARYGSRYPHYRAGIVQAVLQETNGSDLELSSGAVTITGVNGAPGTPLRVTVVYTLPTILGQIIGLPNLHLRASTEMVIFGSG